MGIFVRYRFLFLFFLLGCDNDFFPAGIYDYQVERILSDGDSKMWNQLISTDGCQDSVRLLIQLIPSTSDDSLIISEILRGVSCMPDTLFTRNADASSFEGSLLFTDSLNFSNGDYWIIELITNTNLRLKRNSEITNYILL